MADIEPGRSYSLEEAAQILGVTAQDIRQCLSQRAHTEALASGELNAQQMLEVLKTLKPYLIIGIPDAGRVTAEAETDQRQLWKEHGAISTTTGVQFRFKTEEEARAAIAKLPSYPGYTWSYIRVEHGQNAYEVFDAQVASR